MAPEGRGVRFAGRDVLRVPGSRSALNRTVAFVTPGGVTIRIPDVASALSLKGAAYHLPGANQVRHLQDAVTLFASADRAVLELSTSMRRNINYLINALPTAEAWSASDPLSRRRAVRAVRQVRPDWAIPDFVIPQRPPATESEPTGGRATSGREGGNVASPGVEHERW